MVKISFTYQSRKDLKEIKEFISFDSRLQAQRVVEKIIKEIQKLTQYPELGRAAIVTKKI